MAPKLIAYSLDSEIEIVPAKPERKWMDEAQGRAPYRCLPLVIANSHGWELLNPVGFSAIWSGGGQLGDIVIMPDDGPPVIAQSHFGAGILTFRVPFLFRTEAETDLVVQGPINRPKDAIAPLTGIVETDWLPFTFTMNWKFTRPRTAIRFSAGEPFCHLFPVRRGDVEAVEPEIRPIAEDPDLERRFLDWRASRTAFKAALREPDSEAKRLKWQKTYQRGEDHDGAAAPSSHRTRGRPKPFRKA